MIRTSDMCNPFFEYLPYNWRLSYYVCQRKVRDRFTVFLVAIWNVNEVWEEKNGMLEKMFAQTLLARLQIIR